VTRAQAPCAGHGHPANRFTRPTTPTDQPNTQTTVTQVVLDTVDLGDAGWEALAVAVAKGSPARVTLK
jgi:hypothetical protein